MSMGLYNGEKSVAKRGGYHDIKISLNRSHNLKGSHPL